MTTVDLVLLIAGAPLLGFVAYLTLIVAAGTRPRVRRGHPLPRLAVLIPAHNEELLIGETVKNIRETAQAAGAEIDLLVVADNCSDKTAAAARGAGARVSERFHETERGKGFALAHGIGVLAADDGWEYVLVVDADTILDADFFGGLGPVLGSCPAAVQAHYRGTAEAESWRTRGLSIAWSVFNYRRPLGRTRLGGTAGILGNGFLVRRDVTAEVSFASGSIVEDAEYALRLLERGHRVVFAPEAAVFGRIEAGESTARGQRVRWEAGRVQVARTWIPRLAGGFLRSPSLARLDAMLDLATPPLAMLAGAVAMVGVVAAVAGAWVAAAAMGGALAILLALVVVSMRSAGVPLAHLASIVHLPVYIFWKLRLYAAGSFWRPMTWNRTPRETKTAELPR